MTLAKCHMSSFFKSEASIILTSSFSCSCFDELSVSGSSPTLWVVEVFDEAVGRFKHSWIIISWDTWWQPCHMPSSPCIVLSCCDDFSLLFSHPVAHSVCLLPKPGLLVAVLLLFASRQSHTSCWVFFLWAAFWTENTWTQKLNSWLSSEYN